MNSRLIASDGDTGQCTRLTNRLTAFSALLFTLDIAATVDPLVPEAEQIRQELIDELKERETFS